MKTYAVGLRCDDCGSEFSLREPLTTCPKCGGLLEVQYDKAAMKAEVKTIAGDERFNSMWRYRQFFPEIQEKNIVTMGEGRTPLIKSIHLAKKLGIENLYFKNDTMMPTGSFKDRGFSLAVSYAKEIGIQRGFTYSSGNAGSSLAAYSSRGDFNAVIVVEYVANSLKKALIQLYGGKTAILEYENFGQISTMLEQAVSKLGLYQFVNFINPIRHEAMKTYAYEIVEDLGKVPDAMFHPVGTGGGIWGTYKGYNELAYIGFTDRVPRMFGVQPEACAHFKEAFDRGAKEAGAYGDYTKTIAQSIASDSPLQGGRRLLRAMYESGGGALAVSDEEIMEAMCDLAKDGIAGEPSSAAAVAAMKQAYKAGTIQSGDTVVCVITGSAFKQPSSIQLAGGEPKMHINANVDELASLLQHFGI